MKGDEQTFCGALELRIQNINEILIAILKRTKKSKKNDNSL